MMCPHSCNHRGIAIGCDDEDAVAHFPFSSDWRRWTNDKEDDNDKHTQKYSTQQPNRGTRIELNLNYDEYYVGGFIDEVCIGCSTIQSNKITPCSSVGVLAVDD